MGYIILGVIAVLLFFFVVIPLIRILFSAFIAFLGSLLAIAIGVGLLIVAIWLCVLFPPLFIPVVIFVVYSLVAKKSDE